MLPLANRSDSITHVHLKLAILAVLVLVAGAISLALPLPVLSGQVASAAPPQILPAIGVFAPAGPIIDAAGSVTIPLCISIAYQGHGDPGTARWTLPVATTIYTASTTGVITSWVQTTDANGGYCHQVPFPDSSGSIDIEVKHSHTLSNKKFNILISSITGYINMGTLLEGDADDSNVVSLVDFSILRTTYAQTCPPCDKRADFNEDNYISILDFSLLRTNYGRSGPVTVP